MIKMITTTRKENILWPITENSCPDIVGWQFEGVRTPRRNNTATHARTHAHTHKHTQPFYGSLDFVRNNPGELAPEETFTHSHPSWSSNIPISFLRLL